MTGPLAQIEHWPVANAAAAVVALRGTTPEVVDAHGDIDRRFALASVTKLLTAYAVLVAVEERSLSLDDPAGPPGATIRHLLSHASGLGPAGEVLRRPGTHRIYTNAGFELLGGVLVDATGMAAADYLGEAVCAPLAMASTRLDGSVASGAASTARDLARFAAELLAPTLLATSTVHEATTVAFPGLAGVLPGFGRQATNDWGLGFEVRDHKAPHWTGATNAPATFGHFGQSGSFLWVDPSAGRALVFVGDEPFGPWAIDAWPPLADAVLADGDQP